MKKESWKSRITTTVEMNVKKSLDEVVFCFPLNLPAPPLTRGPLCYSLRLRFSAVSNSRHLSGQSLNRSRSRTQINTVAVGSDRAAKIMAVRACVERIAAIDSQWAKASVVARAVTTNAPAMPLTDWQLMQGARERALAVRDVLRHQRLEAEIYTGLEGGFHSVSIEGEWHTFLRGWAYATDGKTGYFGASPSISVPASIARSVVEGRQELGWVIDEVSGARDVRSRQGAFGVFTRDLITRSGSFEMALIAAFAPFYNSELYS